jgi:hypothetical protein
VDLHKAYLINLQIQREQREYSHWQRLVKEAKRETHLTSRAAKSSEQPRAKRTFWARIFKRGLKTRSSF